MGHNRRINGLIVKNQLEALDMDAFALIDELNCSPRTVKRILNSPSYNTKYADEIAAVLGLNVDDIVDSYAYSNVQTCQQKLISTYYELLKTQTELERGIKNEAEAESIKQALDRLIENLKYSLEI